MLIKNSKIITMEDSIIENGYIIFDNEIKEVGEMENCPEYDGEIIDAKGGYLLPGFIDIHTHLGIIEDGIGFEGDDVNEDNDPISPQLSPIDAINPMERGFTEALKSGVTSAVVSPGSANPIAGQLIYIKTMGKRIDNMVIDTIGMKFSLGENPKTVYNDKHQTPVTRMATAALIRENLRKAMEYLENSEDGEDVPDYDIKLESLLPLLKGDHKAHFHAHRADDIFTAIRICKEFNIEYVIVHGTEAYMIADEIEDSKIISGPFMTDRSKPELVNLTDESPKHLSDSNILFSISTDHPETPLKYLLNCALIAVKAGLDEMKALEAITINPAKIIGYDHKVGSIKVGKDSDLVLFTGNPFDYKSRVLDVFVNGKRG